MTKSSEIYFPEGCGRCFTAFQSSKKFRNKNFKDWKMCREKPARSGNEWSL